MMKASGRPDISDLFDKAWEKSPAERSAFLDEACKGDDELRVELEQLLRAYDQGSSFFKSLAALRAYVHGPGEVSDVAAAPPARSRDPYGFIGRRVSHYDVEALLGVGGMGVVYKAEDVRLKRPVALKFLPPKWIEDERARRRFFREAQAASALDHVNILTVHDIGDESGLPFISMAFCDGETLAERLEKGSFMPLEAIDIASQLASGLAAAHRMGIIHRDIKPSNVMLTRDGLVKVLDFGLAKFADLKTTGTGRVAGTPGYMSPEQLRGEDLDYRTDIWSFGVLIYQMLAGRLPFSGPLHHVVIYSILHEQPDFGALGDVPTDLRQLVAMMLVKNPVQRTLSTEAVFARLQACRKAVETPKVHTPQLFRRRWIATSFAAVLVLLVAAVLIPWQHLTSANLAMLPEDFVLVADFENRTDERNLDHSPREAMIVALRQSAHVNLLSKERVAGALARMTLPADTLLNLNIALEVARREGARAVLSGDIQRLGRNYVLTSKVVDPVSAETVRIRRVEIGRIEDVLSGIDRLAREVRADFGESISDITTSSEPLEMVTTKSIEALELYSRGVSVVMKDDYATAIELIEGAVALDSTFAEAVSALSELYRRVGRLDRALHYHKKVLPLLRRVTQRERFEILATYYGPSFEMDYDSALKNARSWTTMYPLDGLAHLVHGQLAMYMGETAAALRLNQRAAELESSYTGYVLSMSGFAQALAGNADEAIDLFRVSKSYRPEYDALEGFIAQALWMRMDFDSVEASFEPSLTSDDRLRRLKTNAHLAAFFCFRGQLQRAVDKIDDGIAEVRRSGRTVDESYFHLLAGEVARRRGNTTEFVHLMEEAVRTSESPFVDLTLAGMSLAEMGFVTNAIQALRRLRSVSSDDPFFLRRRDAFEHLLQGSIDQSRGEDETASAHFSAVEQLHRGDAIFLLAREKLARVTLQRDEAAAIELFMSLLDRRGEVVMAFLPTVRDGGVWTSRFWPETHLELGRIYTNRGEYGAAAGHLKAALEIWEGSDEDFQYAREARRLAALADMNQFITTD